MEVVRFFNQEREYEAWTGRYPDGFVLHLNAAIGGSPGPGLHRATCIHINFTDPRWNYTTAEKFCCATRDPLIQLLRERTGNEPAQCTSCM